LKVERFRRALPVVALIVLGLFSYGIALSAFTLSGVVADVRLSSERTFTQGEQVPCVVNLTNYSPFQRQVSVTKSCPCMGSDQPEITLAPFQSRVLPLFIKTNTMMPAQQGAFLYVYIAGTQDRAELLVSFNLSGSK
jgi:hypothetical protein